MPEMPAANSVQTMQAPSSIERPMDMRLLTTALAGSLLIGVSGPLVGSSVADIQGAIGASADEGSWMTTAYTMALLSGIVFSSPLIAAFGLGRYMAAAALIFAMAAIGCAIAPPLPALIILRALQGFAAGGFGPIAFVATFATTRGPRLPFGLAVLALILLLPATFGPVAAGLLEDGLGWQALFLVQAAIGASLAAAALLFMPRTAIAWAALRRDWAGSFLLASALATSLLVLTQGTRRYWFDSALIEWSLAIAAGSWAGFLVTLRHSPMPVVNLRLFAKRAFVVPITLNLLFRAGFAGTIFLVPQFLAVIQGYRALELAHLYLWAAIPQLLAFPVAWWLLQRVEGRLVAACGLVLFGLGALLAADGTGADAAEQLRTVLAFSGAGQVLFLVPNLVAGGSVLSPPDAPTATLAFNGTTVGGASLGVAVATELLTERHLLHAGTLAEAAAAYGTKFDRLEAFAGAYAARVGEDALAAAHATTTVAGSLARQAWVLSFNDAFLVVAVLLIASCAAMAPMHRQPPLRTRNLERSDQ